MHLDSQLLKYSSIIDSELQNYFLKQKKLELYKATAHLLNAGGKKIRSILILLLSEAISGAYIHTIPSAVAIELLHTFTLVHDDIMDHSSIRRNVETVHKIWGESNAILTGDTLYLMAIEVLSNYSIFSNKNYKINKNPKLILEIINLIVKTGIEICEGQWLDLSFENNNTITEDQYLNMINKKTAVLFGTSSKIAGLLNEVDKKTVDSLYNFGLYLGMAFQLEDDILDLFDTIEQSRKTQFSDIKEKKMTLLIIHAMKNGVDIYSFYSKKEPISKSNIEKLKNEILESGSVLYVQNMAQDYIEKCKKELNVLNKSPQKTLLLCLLNNIIKKHY